MAKVTGPLFSLGATQQLGKTLVYFTWKGLNVVRSYVIPANPKTALQTTQRGYLTTAVAKIHSLQALATNPLTASDIQAYSLLASVIQRATTWFNQATRMLVDLLVAAKTAELCTDGTTTPGVGELAVSIWDTDGNMTAGDFWYGTSRTALIHSESGVLAAGEFTATIAGLTAGVKYYWQFKPTTPAGAVGANSGIYFGRPT